MISSNQHIEDKLNSCALIIRKYDLGDKAYFFSKFPGMKRETLETAWNFGLQKIQNREIIKNAHTLGVLADGIVKEKLQGFENKAQSIFYYLNSEFDVKKLKLTDENIERNFRNKLAIRYLQVVTDEILVLHSKAKNTIKTRTVGVFKKLKYGLIAIAVVGIFSIPRIIKGLTPFETLTEQIHENSKYKYRTGATCRDGTPSNATGRGACSHHGGVAEWIYGTGYRKTIEECRKEAQEISWRK